MKILSLSNVNVEFDDNKKIKLYQWPCLDYQANKIVVSNGVSSILVPHIFGKSGDWLFEYWWARTILIWGLDSVDTFQYNDIETL